VRDTFDYAIVRVVPRVERGEQINVGAIVYCRTKSYLEARIALDRDRLRALDPSIDLAAVEEALALIPLVAAGDERAGPIAQLPQADRFHWLVSPRSTIAQVSAVHTGLCGDPDAVLTRLMATMVATPAPTRG
jgi:hypothetical protein